MTSERTTPVNYRSNEFTIPERLRPFAEPALIAGESREDYELLRQLLIEDIQPQSNLEWLWVFDLAELSWEILRYRKSKVCAIAMHRAKAIEVILMRIDGAGLPENSFVLRQQTRMNVAEWRNASLGAIEIEERLARGGFDIAAINTEAVVQSHGPLVMLSDPRGTRSSRRTGQRDDKKSHL